LITQSIDTSDSGSEADIEGGFDVSNIPQLPQHVSDFFSTVASTGYPKKQAIMGKAQPWLKVWEGIVEPDSKGEVLVACPKKCDFGKTNLVRPQLC
jgi:hypothetical protein